MATKKARSTRKKTATQHPSLTLADRYLNMFSTRMDQSCSTEGCEKAVDLWVDRMKSFLKNIECAGTSPADPAGITAPYKDYASKIHEVWGMMNPVSAFFAHGHKGLHSATAGFDPAGFFISLPAMGYTREKQEDLQDLADAWTTYVRKLSIYNSSMAAANVKALEKFQNYLHHPPLGAKPLSSVKDIFSKWVDISESVHTEFAVSSTHIKIYGDVVNAMMDYHAKLNKITNEAMENLDLPTRQEVESLHQKVHELKRKCWGLKGKK